MKHLSEPVHRTRLSVLDLSPIIEGGTPAQALRNSRSLAQHAEAHGYQRYWMAEHHNMPGIASSATAVALGFVAEGTQRIRVGAGGIMLPNHAPLMIAEQFGTLAELYPGRIDLGLGRAPGTDQLTARALRRAMNSDPNAFPQDVLELMAFLDHAEPAQAVRAVPGAGTNVPIWILGSSLFGAQLAAALGLPYAFASHFAPAALDQALAVYRDNFKPSSVLSEPYVMLGFNVCAADTEAEAKLLRSSSLQAVVRMRKGMPGPLPAPDADFEAQLTPQDRHMVEQFTQCSAVGTPDQVAEKVDAFIERTGANELMIVGQIFDHAARLRSYGMLSDALRLEDHGASNRPALQAASGISA
ncbi:MAG: LLM class flavin-dependent oxidoreductase [Pseudomonadales bacterium]